jgi:acetolactate decarboxylase
VETRTVLAQTPPYPPLTEVTKGQAVTTFRDLDGDLAGVRTPDFAQGIQIRQTEGG